MSHSRTYVMFWVRRRWAAIWIAGSLGLAVGLATAAWSVAWATWLMPLNTSRSEQLVSVGFFRSQSQTGRSLFVSFAEYADLVRNQRAFSEVAGVGLTEDWFFPSVSDQSTLKVAAVTANLLSTLGVVPRLGRDFAASDGLAGTPVPAIIASRAWRTLFGGAADVIGRTVDVTLGTDGVQRILVIGVLPPDVEVRSNRGDLDLLVAPKASWQSPRATDRGGAELFMVARLLPTVGLAQAEDRMTALFRDSDRLYPNPWFPTEERRAALLPLHKQWFGDSRLVVVRMGMVALLIVAVAYANVLGILIVIARQRVKEVSIRRALGETTRHLWTATMLELVPLALLASVISVVVAQWLVWLARLEAASLPRISQASVDWPALSFGLLSLFVLFVSLVTVLAALQASRSDMWSTLQGGGWSPSSRFGVWLRRAVVTAQVAVVMVLFVGATLLGTSLWRLLSQPLGFRPENVIAARIVPTRHVLRAGESVGLFRSLLLDLTTTLATHDVAITADPPLGLGRDFVRTTFPDGSFHATVTKAVSEGYFQTMGIALVAGRDIISDEPDECPAVVNSTFARIYYGQPSLAVGQPIKVGTRSCRIVGVTGDVREGRLTEQIPPTVYPRLNSQVLPSQLYVVARVHRSVGNEIAAVHDAIRKIDPGAFVTVAPVLARFDAQTEGNKFNAELLIALAICTALLAAFGIAVTVAQATVERRREMAIRLALGAGKPEVIWRIVRTTSVPVGSGILLGAVGISIFRDLFRGLLFETTFVDVRVWSAAALALLTLTAFAAWLPAREAAETDPAIVLRQD